MHSFKDATGRAWNVEINVAQIKAVRSAVGVDCYKLIEDKLQGLAALLGDPCAFVDALYVLCQAQAKAANLSDEDFGRSLGGDALEAAAEAFVEELTDFFPGGRRAALRKVTDKARLVATLMLDQATAELDRFTPERLAALLGPSQSAAPTSSASPGSVPAPSASIPGPGPSASS